MVFGLPVIGRFHPDIHRSAPADNSKSGTVSRSAFCISNDSVLRLHPWPTRYCAAFAAERSFNFAGFFEGIEPFNITAPQPIDMMT